MHLVMQVLQQELLMLLIQLLQSLPSSTFTVDENATAVGTVTATDIQSVTFTLSGIQI